MYEIEIEYRTGNSFGSHSETDRVGTAFETLEEAKLALKHITEHYKEYQKTRYYGSRVEKPRVKGKPWYVEGDGSYDDSWQYSLILAGKKISCFWVGYFETLDSATIVSPDDSELRAVFQ